MERVIDYRPITDQRTDSLTLQQFISQNFDEQRTSTEGHFNSLSQHISNLSKNLDIFEKRQLGTVETIDQLKGEAARILR